MSLSFAGQVVWITGASAGIGESLARAFAREGAKTVLSARREPELQRVASTLGDAAESLVLPMDVTELEAIPEKLTGVMDRFGRVDVLVSNAGVTQRSVVSETELDTYRRLLEVDFLSAVALTKAVLPIMQRQRSGLIVVTSSVAGKYGIPLRSGYCAAKHALHGFFDTLRAEVSGDNIQVSTLVVGSVRTDISLNALRGDGSRYGKMDDIQTRGMDPDRAAEVALRGLRRRDPEIPVGRGLEMRALLLKRFFPRSLFRLMEKVKTT